MNTRTTATCYFALATFGFVQLWTACETNTMALNGGKTDAGKSSDVHTTTCQQNGKTYAVGATVVLDACISCICLQDGTVGRCTGACAPDAGGKDVSSTETLGPSYACTQAGGSCVAVIPGACASGTLTPSLSCGSGVGSTCCIPGGAGGSNGTGGAGGNGGASGTGGARATGGSSGAGGKNGSGGNSGTGGTTSVPTNACTQAGGTCVTGAPGSCSGTTNALSCGPAIGGICCIPGGAGGTGGGGSGAGGKSGSGGNSGTGGTTSVPVNACTQGGGACVAVYPGSCASGIPTSLSCGSGIGVECCMPGGGGDGGIDGGAQALAALCTTTGGHPISISCCTSSADYPDTCQATGGCGCSSANSKTISSCDCGASHCFDQSLGCGSR